MPTPSCHAALLERSLSSKERELGVPGVNRGQPCRLAFAVAFLMAFFSTVMVFGYLTEFSQIFWMIPLMGFCQLSLFGGYAIYFPELFPTHLRSTGTSFCYNVGRFVAASGPILLGALIKYVFVGYPEPMRYAGVCMSFIFIIGLMALPFAPETKGRPLPE